MPIQLYDLAGRDDRRFSPHCWKVRMALAHKGLDYITIATPFTDIASSCGEGATLPFIEDGEVTVVDSLAIADYLEATYPATPSLFDGDGGRALSLFVQNWSQATLHPQIARLVLLDIHDHLLDKDQGYFRQSREAAFGETLEQVQAGRDERVPAFRNSLQPLRLLLKNQDYLGGAAPLFADYIVFGALQWVRVTSPLKLLEADDAVSQWFERCSNLYDGIGSSTLRY